MKALLLYSGGKDSSLVAYLLQKLGYEFKCLTANFGVNPECANVAKQTAKTLGFEHEVFTLDSKILEDGVEVCLKEGYAKNGINHIHMQVLEEACKAYAKEYRMIADGCRRDDKTPKIEYPEIQSLEARYNIEYFCPLNGFPHATIKYLTEKLFKIQEIKAGSLQTSEYETEIRALLQSRGISPDKIFPKEHYHTIVTGWKK